MKKYNRKHTTEAIKQRGEVFTPLTLVDEMLDKIPQKDLINPEKTIGDISGCGNGNFLIRVLERRMAAGVSHVDALKTIYGVDIDRTNVFECKKRLSLSKRGKVIWDILNRNIICADALNPNHPGWKKVGYMWDGHGVKGEMFDLENMKVVDPEKLVKKKTPKKKTVPEESAFQNYVNAEISS